MRVFSVYIPASSVVCVQHTPSSKRNLSSKILHKSLPTYFLTLTKQPSKNNLRHLKESFLSDLSTRRWCQCQCLFSTFFSLETSSSERPVACTIISQDAPSRIRFIAIFDCPSLSPSSLPSLRPSSRPSLSPSSLPTLTRVLDLIVCVPFRIHGFNVFDSVLVVKLGEFRYILGINPVQFRNFLFCQTCQF